MWHVIILVYHNQTIFQVQFTLVNRRHHCRKCGVVCCNTCSSKRCCVWIFSTGECILQFQVPSSCPIFETVAGVHDLLRWAFLSIGWPLIQQRYAISSWKGVEFLNTIHSMNNQNRQSNRYSIVNLLINWSIELIRSESSKAPSI